MLLHLCLKLLAVPSSLAAQQDFTNRRELWGLMIEGGPFTRRVRAAHPRRTEYTEEVNMHVNLVLPGAASSLVEFDRRIM